MEVPLGFEFILYKYGPSSFELSEELTSFCADSFLDLEVRSPKYGPSYINGDMSDYIVSRFPKTLDRYQKEINFVADQLGTKHVPELERLATALYVRSKYEEVTSVKKRVAKIRELKPHVSEDDAATAVNEVENMLSEYSKL
jgi:hypothetical protein